MEGGKSLEQAQRQIYHTTIKHLQERIKEKEEKIEVLLVWGLGDSKDPKIIERQQKEKERRKREDPVIIKLQQEIDAYRKEIADMEQELLLNNNNDDRMNE